MLGVQEVPREQTRQYGIVSSTNLEPGVEKVNGIVEKPKPEDGTVYLGGGRALYPDAAYFSPLWSRCKREPGAKSN